MTKSYSTGLCACRADTHICLKVLCCGWTNVPSSQLWAQSRGEKCTLWHWGACAHPVWARANIRRLRGETDTRYGRDCCVCCWCWPLALCQDLREMNYLTPTVLQELPQQLESVPPAPYPPPRYPSLDPIPIANPNGYPYTGGNISVTEPYYAPPPSADEGSGFRGYPPS
jgi:hypothetical protein